MSEIREITEKDLDALQDVLSNLSDTGCEPAPRITLAFRENRDETTYGYFDDDDQLVGTISLLMEWKFIHDGGLVGHIEDVATKSGCEGRGIGQALVAHAVEECRRKSLDRNRKCYKVILDCDKDLVGFYEKAGFREVGVCMRMDF